MIIWMLALGVAWIVLGTIVLVNRERMLRWTQKHLRQNVGEIGKAVADVGKPRYVVVPAIGTIAIGLTLIYQSLNP